MKPILSLIYKRLQNAHPDHHLIAKGMAWVALFVFLGKIAGAAKEMAVASRYGVSGTVDAYLFIFNLVTWPVSLWFSVLSVVLIPLASRIRKDSPEELFRFRSELLGLTLLIGLTLILFFWIGLPLLMNSQCTGLPSSSERIAINMVPGLALVALLGVLTSLFSTWTMSAGRQINTLLEGVPSLTILLALLFFSGSGAGPLVWGTLTGFVLYVMCLVVSLFWHREIEGPKFTCHSPYWSIFWQGFGIMLAGETLMSFISIIDQFFAGHLGIGAIASIGYANRVLSLILGLGATAVARATLPVFSQIHVWKDQSYRLVIQWMGILFVLGVFAMLITWWLAPWILKLIFERGAFTAKDTQMVTEIFRYGLPQLPFYFACLVLVSFLASQREYKLMAIVAGINLIIKATANFTFVSFMGIKGILAATDAMYMVSFAMLYFFVTVSFKKKGQLE